MWVLIFIFFRKHTPYEAEKNVKVTEGFSIFKSTRTEKVMDQRAGINVDYEDVRIDGWILKIYYVNVDTVVNAKCSEQNILLCENLSSSVDIFTFMV